MYNSPRATKVDFARQITPGLLLGPQKFVVMSCEESNKDTNGGKRVATL